MDSKDNNAMKNSETVNVGVSQKASTPTVPYNKTVRVRHRLNQAVCLLIILCLLTVSTPAAPGLMAEKAFLLQQNTVIFFKVNDWLSFFDWVSFFSWNKSKAAKQETQAERNAQVTKIVIDSNESVFIVGKQIPLFAVAYDNNDKPVSGVNFEWEIQDSEGNRQEITDNIFTAKAAGEYKVTVSGADHEAVGKFIIKNPVNDTVTKPEPEY